MHRMTIAILALVSAAAAGPAVSQPAHCAPRDTVIQRLAEQYGETRRSVGLGANNQVIEVFAAEDTGTWTITVTSATGLTCLVASGMAFEALADALPGPGDDA
jgi:hypothetical protein